MKLSVVIPVYNEVATIEEIVRRVQAVEVDKEILVVDDGSTDGTREKLRRLANEGAVELFGSGSRRARRVSLLSPSPNG